MVIYFFDILKLICIIIFIPGSRDQFDHICRAYILEDRRSKGIFPEKNLRTFIRILSVGKHLKKSKKNVNRFCDCMRPALSHADFQPQEAKNFNKVLIKLIKTHHVHYLR